MLAAQHLETDRARPYHAQPQRAFFEAQLATVAGARRDAESAAMAEDGVAA